MPHLPNAAQLHVRWQEESEQGGDNACLRGHTGGPEVYFCLSLGLLGITQGYKEEKC